MSEFLPARQIEKGHTIAQGHRRQAIAGMDSSSVHIANPFGRAGVDQGAELAAVGNRPQADSVLAMPDTGAG